MIYSSLNLRLLENCSIWLISRCYVNDENVVESFNCQGSLKSNTIMETDAPVILDRKLDISHSNIFPWWCQGLATTSLQAKACWLLSSLSTVASLQVFTKGQESFHLGELQSKIGPRLEIILAPSWWTIRRMPSNYLPHTIWRHSAWLSIIELRVNWLLLSW